MLINLSTGAVFAYAPLLVAAVLTCIFVYADELPKWKIFAVVVLGVSFLFQFVVAVHFLVPFFIQIGLSIVLAFYFQMSNFPKGTLP